MCEAMIPPPRKIGNYTQPSLQGKRLTRKDVAAVIMETTYGQSRSPPSWSRTRALTWRARKPEACTDHHRHFPGRRVHRRYFHELSRPARGLRPHVDGRRGAEHEPRCSVVLLEKSHAKK